ncbi:hypothetical protein LWI29_017053 [Acer saccharum]|uniref:Uncharacterized protein n=1 Tax=Acer saccharum TaxID=4024 RepID=A0AA39VJB2_ACESA|nr:hypothetical protein LWI29_017053 [Acer saccharum]
MIHVLISKAKIICRDDPCPSQPTNENEASPNLFKPLTPITFFTQPSHLPWLRYSRQSLFSNAKSVVSADDEEEIDTEIGVCAAADEAKVEDVENSASALTTFFFD